jgi:hypothetical protein
MHKPPGIANAALLLIVTMCAACGGGKSSTPTSPTPTPSPAPQVRVLSYEPSGPLGVHSYSFSDANETTPGQIALNINANNFNRAVSMFRATVLYEPRTLQVVNFSEGDWLKQGGALATFSVTNNAAGNGVVIRIDKASSVLGSTGSGVVLTLRFRPATGVTSGTSLLQWTDAHAYNFQFDEQLFSTQGGTVTVR